MKRTKSLFSFSVCCIAFLILITPDLITAETAKIDSLLGILKGSKNEDRYEILHDLGWAYRDISTEKALKYENQAIDLAKDWGDSLRVARSLSQLARIYTHKNYELAVKLSERSIELIIEYGENRKVAKYYQNLGYIHEENYEYNRALFNFEKARLLSQKLNDIYSVVNSLKMISRVYMTQGNYKKNLKIVNEQILIGKYLDDTFSIMTSYNTLGNIHLMLSNFTEALNFYNSVLDMIEDYAYKEKINTNEYKSVTYFNIGITNRAIGNYDSAIRYSLEAYKMLNDTNIGSKIKCLDLISLIYIDLEHYQMAYYYNLKSLSFINQLKSKYLYVNTISNLSNSLKKLNKYDQSLKIKKYAIDMYKKIGDNWNLAVAQFNMGELLFLMGNYKKSEECYKQALQLSDIVQDRRIKVDVLNNYVKLLINQKKYKLVQNYLDTSLIIATEIGVKDLIKEAYKIYSEFLISQNQFENAIEYLLLFDSIKSDILSNEKLAGIAQMEVELKALEKQKELDLLEKENAIISLELEKEKLIRIKILIISVALILISIVLILSNKSIKRTNARMRLEIERRFRTEQELMKLNSGLELIILERTSELQFVNQALKIKINEKKESEQKLIDAEKMAGIGELAAGIAHEIRNPVAIIKSTAQYLSVNYSSKSELMTQLIDSSDEINMIITRLMDFARLKSPESEEIDLVKFIKDCLLNFNNEIQKKDIELEFINSKPTVMMKIDPVLFDILFSNVLNNSLESLVNKGEIQIILAEEQPFIKIDIIDNGIGIDNKNEFLDPFHTTKDHHAGLGLNFVQHIIKLYYGRFEIESKYNEGTVVSLYLPVN